MHTFNLLLTFLIIPLKITSSRIRYLGTFRFSFPS